MNRSRLILVLTILIIVAAAAVNAVAAQRRVSQKEFTAQVLNQYIKYYCPNAGVCSRKKALEGLKRDWPHVYKLGFQVLEENDEK